MAKIETALSRVMQPEIDAIFVAWGATIPSLAREGGKHMRMTLVPCGGRSWHLVRKTRSVLFSAPAGVVQAGYEEWCGTNAMQRPDACWMKLRASPVSRCAGSLPLSQDG